MTDRYAPRFGRPVAFWYRHFAWRPVWTVDRGWVWLRLVWRRQIHKYSYLHGGGSDWWFQHAVEVEKSGA